MRAFVRACVYGLCVCVCVGVCVCVCGRACLFLRRGDCKRHGFPGFQRVCQAARGGERLSVGLRCPKPRVWIFDEIGSNNGKLLNAPFLRQVGPMLDLHWAKLGLCWSMLGSWGHVGATLSIC